MKPLTKELKALGMFFVATSENDIPDLRPFSSVTEFEDRTYICTTNIKDCYRQIMSNPHVVICGSYPDGGWIRVRCTLTRDDRRAARQAMIDDPTGPGDMHTADDGIFEVLYIDHADCTVYRFPDEPRSFTQEA